MTTPLPWRRRVIQRHPTELWDRRAPPFRNARPSPIQAGRQQHSDSASTTRVGEASSSQRLKDVKRERSACRSTARERAEDKNFVLSVLSSSTTRRDAKTFLANFAPGRPVARPRLEVLSSLRSARNAPPSASGAAGSPPRAVLQAPSFMQDFTSKPVAAAAAAAEPDLERYHLALVKLRAPHLLDDAALGALGLTFSQLMLLGLRTIVVLDSLDQSHRALPEKFSRGWADGIFKEADRVVDSILRHNTPGARRIDDAFCLVPQKAEIAQSGPAATSVEVENADLLYSALSRSVVPVITTMACIMDTQTRRPITADEAILALTREFSGTNPLRRADDVVADAEIIFRPQISLDRIILLEPLGGLPDSDGARKSHYFVNLCQEYSAVRNSLTKDPTTVSAPSTIDQANHLVGGESVSASEHVRNLDLVQQSLMLLPASSSALIITPAETASSAVSAPKAGLGVRTRRPNNPLIHNLLTDKPFISSSLPLARLSQVPLASSELIGRVGANPPTFIKRGMPLSIIPDPRHSPWRPPGQGAPALKLTDAPLDFSRLLNLVEDSFSRPLDVKHYLTRIGNRLAGVIVAGEYEGGAILTWETPRKVNPCPPRDDDDDDDVSGPPQQHLSSPPADHAEPEEDPVEPVPYLDKFAVLKRSQGSGGVADMVFSAMVRDCFPGGVVWRSRTDNPVNRWYFERAVGCWKLPGTNWTMFWTIPRLETRARLWRDCVAVCRDVEPSWADSANPAD